MEEKKLTEEEAMNAWIEYYEQHPDETIYIFGEEFRLDEFSASAMKQTNNNTYFLLFTHFLKKNIEDAKESGGIAEGKYIIYNTSAERFFNVEKNKINVFYLLAEFLEENNL
jgi:hypothetical protein